MICRKKIKKIILFVALLTVSIYTAFALGKADEYDELMKTGSVSDIKAAMRKDSDMFRCRLGSDKDTLLMRAIKYNRSESVIKLMLRAGVNISAKNAGGHDALMYVCRYSNDEPTLKLILKKSGSNKALREKLLRKNKDGSSALDYAKNNSDPTALSLIQQYLRPEDINPEQTMREKYTVSAEKQPPEETSAAEYSERQTELPETKASVPEHAAVTQTPAEVPPEPKKTAAAENTAPALIYSSSEAEDNKTAPAAEKTEQKPSGQPVPELPVSKYKKIYLYDYAPSETDEVPQNAVPAQTALAHIEKPDVQDADGRTALMKAVKAGNDWEVRSLINSGASVNIKDNDGWTALMYAIRYQNNLDLVNILIKYGADIQASNKYGTSVLQLAACYSDNPEILQRVLSSYSPGENEVFKSFILAITAVNNSVLTQTVKLQIFINKGIPLNRFHEGRTPLMYAAQYSSSTEIIKLLLDNGAVPSIRTADGKTAFDFARANSRLEHDETYWLLNTGR